MATDAGDHQSDAAVFAAAWGARELTKRGIYEKKRTEEKMTKRVLIVDSSKERLAIYRQVRPQFAPDLELTTVENMEQALAALATASVDTIVLETDANNDSCQNEMRHRQLTRACPGAECVIYNTGALASLDDLCAFFQLFSLSPKNIPYLYPRPARSEKQS